MRSWTRLCLRGHPCPSTRARNELQHRRFAPSCFGDGQRKARHLTSGCTLEPHDSHKSHLRRSGFDACPWGCTIGNQMVSARTCVELEQHSCVEGRAADQLYWLGVEVALERAAAEAIDPLQPPILCGKLVERLRRGTLTPSWSACKGGLLVWGWLGCLKSRIESEPKTEGRLRARQRNVKGACSAAR